MGDPKVKSKNPFEAYDHVGPSFEQIEIQEAWARVKAAKRRRFAKEQAEIAAYNYNYCSSHSDEYCEINNLQSSYWIGRQGVPFWVRFGCESAPLSTGDVEHREHMLMCYYGMNALDQFAIIVKDEIPALISALEVHYSKNGQQRKIATQAVNDAAAETLGHIGTPAIPSLTEVLQCSHDQFAREGAAKALGIIGSFSIDNAVADDINTVLITSTKNDPSRRVRNAARRALTTIAP